MANATFEGRVIFLHGNGSISWRFGFAELLKSELEKSGVQTVFETLPDSVMARQEYWFEYLTTVAKVTEDDILVGWSSGAVCAMRYAEIHQIRGSVLVSPSCTDLGEESERVSGYFDRPWEWDKIKSNQRQIALIYGDDDPFIPQHEFELIAKSLDAAVHVVAGGEHFIEPHNYANVVELICQSVASIRQ